MKNLQIKWHIPNEDEIKFVKEIHQLYVIDQLKKLENPENLKKYTNYYYC